MKDNPIPQNALDAALDAFNFDYPKVQKVRTMLTFARPHLQLPIRVKKLDWHQTDKRGHWWAAETLLSENGFADYGICKEDGWYFTVGDEPMIKESGNENWDTVEEAKAAAQADFEKRILRWIEVG